MDPLIQNTKKVKKSKNVKFVKDQIVEIDKVIKVSKAPSKWLTHVKEHRTENPDKSYKQSLIDAKVTYVK